MPTALGFQPGVRKLIKESTERLMTLHYFPGPYCWTGSSELCPLVEKRSDYRFLLLGRTVDLDPFCMCERATFPNDLCLSYRTIKNI